MGSPLILIAETRRDVRQMVREYLEDTGFYALPATSASDIFSAVATMPVGAVVLDSTLRGGDGMDLCRDVRERSNVPIILIGGDESSEVDRVVGLELGADDYMTRPYSTRELAARLRAVLRRGKGDRSAGLTQQAQARFKGWLIDFARRELIAPDGAMVDLTAAEFSLLAVLIDHPQMIIPRVRLMELAGVRDSPSSQRSVDVLISRIRRKLGRSGEPAPIATVRGKGYMLTVAVERHDQH